MFSDEVKVELFGHNDVQTVFRPKNKELDPKYMIPTIKHPKHIMVWGCISSKGVGTIHKIDSKMDAKMYVDIIRKNLGKSVRKLKMGSIGKVIFQQGKYFATYSTIRTNAVSTTCTNDVSTT